MNVVNFFQALSVNFLATLLGGVLLALLFFWAREKLFPLPDITGRWYFKVHTTRTAYNPYDGMILCYIAMLWRVDNRVEGTVEKIYENSSTGSRSYVGKNRTRGRVQGYVQKNYFAKDRVFLHVIEDGHSRESTNFYDLHVQPHGRMIGRFDSMVAEQSGDVEWQREAF
jgi:hypothetical protein